ncbi:MAG TPA: DUF4440 domain-containing protein [Pyrinomonadaceae bacterium]|jgi:hypothetical protein|nr:DUF4440 domain-containing protein [Pyrinomonadaceae bacterium]
MKKLIALVCLLVLAAACTMQPSGNKDMTANANKAPETKSAAPPSEADIIAKEKAGWDAFKRKDADAFKKLLTPDYLEVLDDGTKDTAAAVASMNDSEISEVNFSDWKMTTIDKDAVLLTYKVTVKAKYKGQDIPPGPYYEAAAYVSRNGEWLAIYYQETLSQAPMPPPPTPKEAASSPMAKPADTTADAAANEKLVWDALKSRNYDAFGAYLADNSIEIEADGVYDKAGSIKSVQGFDASKAELSDWKTVKFDDDASLVTYVVKISAPKPMTEYHSTIWISKDGKWRALFHMGTPAGSPTGAASPEKKM